MYFEEEPVSPLKMGIIKTKIRGYYFEFYTASGVFSSKQIDYGTRLLLDYAEIDKNDDILDLGCGYGVIGIVAAKITDGKVYLTDINKRAVWLAKKNIRLNRVNAIALHGDLYEPVKDLRFDKILTNPPISAGYDTLNRIITEGIEHLNKNGSIQLVLSRGRNAVKERYKSLMDIKVLKKKGGYTVMKMMPG
ncbi:MAG: class I SAM-dependent methyltransferase [Candidatus Hydrothermarchaeota archaeon]